MKDYQIWSEGYRDMGSHESAQLMGTESGIDFTDATKKFMARNPEAAKYFNIERMTHWGCKLFDNEIDARKSFG